jgi:hypothetical protein
MNIDFTNIEKHVVRIEDFQLKWRFTEEEYNVLPEEHLERLKPLDKVASKFLADFISNSSLHQDVPFKKNFFRTLDKAKITNGNEREIKKWLYERGIQFDKEVYLSWNDDNGMIAPWQIVIKYFDSFYYGSSDDLTIFDQSFNWAILFFHEDEIYFGTNKDYKPKVAFEDVDFTW